MIETVLILPLIFAVLAILIYMGRGVVRVQHAQVMDRYEAWREVSPVIIRYPGALDIFDDQGGEIMGPSPSLINDIQFNQAFFGGNAESITGGTGQAFPTDATDSLLNSANGVSSPTGQLAQEVIGLLPRGASAAFATRHANGVQFWQQFEGPISHGHTRIGNDWAFVNGWQELVLGTEDNPIMTPLPETEPDPLKKIALKVYHPWAYRTSIWQSSASGAGVIPHGSTYSVWQRIDTLAVDARASNTIFFGDFDTPLQAVQANDNCLATGIRNSYLSEPGYAGPNMGY